MIVTKRACKPGKPVFMAARHRQLLLPSTFEQVMECCCVGCMQKMLQVPKGPTPASSICCHPRTDHAPSWGYQQGLARIARLRTLEKGFEEATAPWQQPSNPEDTLRERLSHCGWSFKLVTDVASLCTLSAILCAQSCTQSECLRRPIVGGHPHCPCGKTLATSRIACLGRHVDDTQKQICMLS